MRRSRVNSPIKACLFPHLFTPLCTSLPWDRYTARSLPFHSADEGEHWCRGFHLASFFTVWNMSVKRWSSPGDVWQQSGGVVAPVQAFLSTTQINREQRLRHIYLWAQWWIHFQHTVAVCSGANMSVERDLLLLIIWAIMTNNQKENHKSPGWFCVWQMLNVMYPKRHVWQAVFFLDLFTII